jgi:hypothetical protein
MRTITFLKDSRGWIVLGIVALSLCLLPIYKRVRDERAAAALIVITQSVVLTTTTEDEFLNQTKPYVRYLSNQANYSGLHEATYRVGSSNALIGLTTAFRNGKAVGRAVGMVTKYCYVSTEQWIGEDRSVPLEENEALRRNSGDQKYLRFAINPALDPNKVRTVFNYQAHCLLPLTRCDSVDRINPYSSKMLHDSIQAGY